MMDECPFAKEIKEYVLPTRRDVIGHYYHVRNWIMCSDKKYLKRPPFNICKQSVLGKIEFLWSKSHLPIINNTSMETKLKKLILQYASAKTDKNGLESLQLDTLFDISCCKCDIKDPVERYEKVFCKCPVEKRVPIQGKLHTVLV